MSIHSFWLIFLKVIGIFLLYSSLSVIPSLVALPMMIGSNMSPEDALVPATVILAGVVVFGVFIYLLLFRTSYVMRLLRLEDDFEEDSLELDVQLVSVLSIATIVTGGVMLVNGLPALVKALTDFFAMSQFITNPNLGWVLYYIAQCVLGYLLITKHKWIVDFIERRAHNDASMEEADDVLDADEAK